jgi:hypothetical protein
MSEFKVGDKVRCIDGERCPKLHDGEVYEVASTSSRGLIGVGDDELYFADRFEHVPAPLVYEHDGREYTGGPPTVAQWDGTVATDVRFKRGDLVFIAEPLPEPTVMVELPRDFAEGLTAWADLGSGDELKLSSALAKVGQACRTALEDR